MHVAASLGSARCVSLLLKYGADVRVQFGNARSTPLHLAAEEGSAECTRLLLEAGAPWNAKNSRGQSALHLAALAQSTETMDFLIKAATDVNMEDSDGRTPLHAAVAKSMRGGELVKGLIQVCTFLCTYDIISENYLVRDRNRKNSFIKYQELDVIIYLVNHVLINRQERWSINRINTGTLLCTQLL